MGQSEPIRPMMIRDYRVLVATSEPHIGKALSVALSFEGYNQRLVAQGEDFFHTLTLAEPHAVIVDKGQLGDQSLEIFMKELFDRRRSAIVSMILDRSDVELAFAAARHGIKNVYSLPLDLESVVRQAGRDLIGAFGTIQRNGTTQHGYTALTPREAEVADLLVSGLANKAIAERLKISPRTVEVHRSKILQKFQAGNTAGFVMKYVRSGLAR